MLSEFQVNRLYMKRYDGTWVLRNIAAEVEARGMFGIYDDTELVKLGDSYFDGSGNPLLAPSKPNACANILKAAFSRGMCVVGFSWVEVDHLDSVCAPASPILQGFGSWAKCLEENATCGISSMFEPFDDSNVHFAFGHAEVEVVNWSEYEHVGGAAA